MAQTPEQKERSRKGGLESVRKRREDAKARKTDPLFGVKSRLSKHFVELEKAASGQGDWKDLPLPQRLSALMRVIEYGVGKSITLDKMAPKDVSSEGGGSETAGTIEFQ